MVGVGSAAVTLTAGNAQTVRISLNGQGRKLLASRHVLKVKLVVTEALGNGQSATVSTQTVTFKTHITGTGATDRGKSGVPLLRLGGRGPAGA